MRGEGAKGDQDYEGWRLPILHVVSVAIYPKFIKSRSGHGWGQIGSRTARQARSCGVANTWCSFPNMVGHCCIIERSGHYLYSNNLHISHLFRSHITFPFNLYLACISIVFPAC